LSKQRVYTVAKQFNLSSEALIGVLRELGVAVKNHMSTIDEETIARVRKKFEEEKAEVRKEYEKKRRQAERKEKVERKKKEPEKKREPPKKAKAKRVRPKRRKIDEKKVRESVKRTLAKIEGRDRIRRRRRTRPTKAVTVEEDVLRVSEFISTADLAGAMGVPATDVISKCLELGLLVTINQRLDMDTIVTVADEFGYHVEIVGEHGAELLEPQEEEEGELLSRPPVVTVMGHVDHGKTLLLDYIRSTNVVAGEAGGITQHIGAYEVELEGGKITFLDTPGHEAFTAMRARGAQFTDLVVLVVAADDGVMPQTIEALNHARAARVPIIIAINKIDLPSADPMRTKQQLMEAGLVPEQWGGKTVAIEVSAKTGAGIPDLLAAILVEAEELGLRAVAAGPARGVVLEARLDRWKGVVATLLVQKGTLRQGDPFVAGVNSGKVRAMEDERGRKVVAAGPSTPVLIHGLSGIPQAGDTISVLPTERGAREISQRRQLAKREQDRRIERRMGLLEFQEQIKAGQQKELKLIVKGDVDGSVEALCDSLESLGTEEVKVRVIHRGVGAVNESDVLLGVASEAVIIGFHVDIGAGAREAADREGVSVQLYNVIYEAIGDVESALAGMLEPELVEMVLGRAEVREIFQVPRVGKVAGCYVISGTVVRNARARVIREASVIHEGRIGSLRRFKDDVKEVATGFECGIGVEGFDSFAKDDIVEAYKVEEVAADQRGQ
jgi:translation initiation factor IF-2